MIHWDWIVTGLVGAVLWKALDSIMHLIAYATYPINRRIINHAATIYAPQAVPIINEVLGDDDEGKKSSTYMPSYHPSTERTKGEQQIP